MPKFRNGHGNVSKNERFTIFQIPRGQKPSFFSDSPLNSGKGPPLPKKSFLDKTIHTVNKSSFWPLKIKIRFARYFY
jgi:hypothetical protein